mmetsp:Transcript_14658/g.41511  ORF Transcript_14658/g.41511 Transcript_14658/m.41511 type:complete len:246 (-) Transcript_14658:375-1112(-)
MDLGGKSKISNLDCGIIILRLQQQVLRLQITMRHALVVHVANRLQQDLRQIARILFGVLVHGDDAVKDVAAAHELHHDEVVIGFLEEVDHLDDVIVIHLVHDGDFVHDGVIILRLARIALDDFDGVLVLPFLVRASLDRCEGSAMELVANVVEFLEFLLVGFGDAEPLARLFSLDGRGGWGCRSVAFLELWILVVNGVGLLRQVADLLVAERGAQGPHDGMDGRLQFAPRVELFEFAYRLRQIAT